MSFNKVDEQFKAIETLIVEYSSSCLVICRSKTMLDRIRNSVRIREEAKINVMMYDSDSCFKFDANERIPKDTVLLIQEKYARGLHKMFKAEPY